MTHYFDHIGVAVLDLEYGLSIGDEIHIVGYNTDITQRVESMEVNHHRVQEVGPGAEVGLKVDDRVHQGDAIYRVMEPSSVEVRFGVG